MTHRLLWALTMSIVVLSASVQAQQDSGSGSDPHREEARYEYRYGIPSETSVATLSDEAEPISFSIVENPTFSDVGIASLVEYHGVYPLSTEELLSAVTAYGDYPRISRRVTESEVWDDTAAPPYEPVAEVVARHRALMRTSFKFLFFGRDYDYELSSMTEKLDRETYLVRSRMTRSLDGGLAAIHYSWYLQPVTLYGKEQSYLRYFARVDFAEEPKGLRLALDLFARSDVERLLESIYRYARTGR
jgi:hypothetical protein